MFRLIIVFYSEAGEIHAYNKELDRARSYKPYSIIPFNGVVFNVDTLSDPVFQRLAKDNVADIFATELAISAIMTSSKSLYSWDVIIKKYQDKIFIDKRDEPNMLDLLTVNETSQEHQPIDDEGINGVRQLMQEATNINHSLLAQACDPNLFDKQDEVDPFIEVEGQVAVR